MSKKETRMFARDLGGQELVPIDHDRVRVLLRPGVYIDIWPDGDTLMISTDGQLIVEPRATNWIEVKVRTWHESTLAMEEADDAGD